MFLDCLDKALVRGKAGFAFDTKLEHRFVGSAGKRIGRKLKKLRMKVVRPHASAIVMGEKGRLKKGLKRRLGR
ncbi:MAG: hypothetical protein WCE81_01820 [Halobacteriota archaeon]